MRFSTFIFHETTGLGTFPGLACATSFLQGPKEIIVGSAATESVSESSYLELQRVNVPASVR